MGKNTEQEIRIIECEAITFGERDLIKLKYFGDLIDLRPDDVPLYVLNDCYYLIMGDVVYYFRGIVDGLH